LVVQRAVGVVNVTLMQASDSISAVASCKPGTPFAMITNMAVTPAMRRRGIAHQLMQVRSPAGVVWVTGA
jgi:N-acetylglutamate synthase-like GNAT family acetyltransferase